MEWIPYATSLRARSGCLSLPAGEGRQVGLQHDLPGAEAGCLWC